MNPYISDILSQPAALRNAINNFSLSSLDPIRQRLNAGEFDRIVITGMGASYNAAYPAYLELTSLPIPVTLVNAAELLHYMDGLIGSRTLFWANSQSGRSVELLRLLERNESNPPAYILTSVNDETSPLASFADICLPIYAGSETTVSTKTYINTLAVNLLAAHFLTGDDLEALKKEILLTADRMETYLTDWQKHVSTLDTLLGEFKTLILIGRGASMSAVWNGALINKEAAKFPLEGMHAADFRHGPMELISPDFLGLILAGSPTTFALNHNLATDIDKHNGRVIWIDSTPDTYLSTFIHPATTDLVRPIVEILPIQFLTIALAKRKNIQPGHFRVVSKVTMSE
ncbi:MAG: SIS domain-containing protein [Anaerolineales bacterium]|jgi:glucosamine--fructose-6-phosphate aminotransferase (isomerizing)